MGLRRRKRHRCLLRAALMLLPRLMAKGICRAARTPRRAHIARARSRLHRAHRLCPLVSAPTSYIARAVATGLHRIRRPLPRRSSHAPSAHRTSVPHAPATTARLPAEVLKLQDFSFYQSISNFVVSLPNKGEKDVKGLLFRK